MPATRTFPCCSCEAIEAGRWPAHSAPATHSRKSGDQWDKAAAEKVAAVVRAEAEAAEVRGVVVEGKVAEPHAPRTRRARPAIRQAAAEETTLRRSSHCLRIFAGLWLYRRLACSRRRLAVGQHHPHVRKPEACRRSACRRRGYERDSAAPSRFPSSPPSCEPARCGARRSVRPGASSGRERLASAFSASQGCDPRHPGRSAVVALITDGGPAGQLDATQ